MTAREVAHMTDRDRTALTKPLTTGQRIVAKWESLNSGWSEPADLAEGIDDAIAAALEEAAKVADEHHTRIGPSGYSDHGSQCASGRCNRSIAAAIRELKDHG